jgi:hypothetical protein
MPRKPKSIKRSDLVLAVNDLNAIIDPVDEHTNEPTPVDGMIPKADLHEKLVQMIDVLEDDDKLEPVTEKVIAFICENGNKYAIDEDVADESESEPEKPKSRGRGRGQKKPKAEPDPESSQAYYTEEMLEKMRPVELRKICKEVGITVPVGKKGINAEFLKGCILAGELLPLPGEEPTEKPEPEPEPEPEKPKSRGRGQKKVEPKPEKPKPAKKAEPKAEPKPAKKAKSWTRGMTVGESFKKRPKTIKKWVDEADKIHKAKGASSGLDTKNNLKAINNAIHYLKYCGIIEVDREGNVTYLID